MRLSAVKCIRKSWSKSFNNGIVYNRVGFKCICATLSRQYTELFYKLFTRATESGWSMWGCSSRNILPIKVPNCYGGKNYVFDTKLSKLSEFYYLEPCLTLPLRILLKPWAFSFKKDTITAKTAPKIKCLEEGKKLRFTLQRKDPVFHSLVRIWDKRSEVMLVMNLE